jgi:hypothetical protein
MSDEIRATNEAALRRFFTDDFAGAQRWSLWALDAVFEMPWQIGGPVKIQGRDAIMAESEEWAGKNMDRRFHDLVIHPTVDPTVFWVTVTAGSKDKRTGEPRIMQLVNYFRVVDGLVVHRIEYFNPGAHPR